MRGNHAGFFDQHSPINILNFEIRYNVKNEHKQTHYIPRQDICRRRNLNNAFLCIPLEPQSTS